MEYQIFQLMKIPGCIARFSAIAIAILCTACQQGVSSYAQGAHQEELSDLSSTTPTDFFLRLSDSALALTRQKVLYDPQYFYITYPNGDVPADRGVCTDVVIRAYRKLKIDLQQLVHEDMAANFDAYPKKWGLPGPDKNIDHRRVPNLMKFFERKGAGLPVTNQAVSYQPGDIVTWDLGHGLTHIGLVVNRRSANSNKNLIVHNIGGGQVLSDCLFSFRIIGHYRFKP